MSDFGNAAFVPRLRDGLQVTSLPIQDPFEGFLLSRIDGFANMQDIADATGADLTQVRELLEKLAGLGALQPTDGHASRSAPPRPFADGAGPQGSLERNAELPKRAATPLSDAFGEACAELRPAGAR